MLARDPPGNVFDIEGNSSLEYSLSAKALEEGVYHVHTQLNVASVGPGLGPGQTVVVEGEPIIKPIPYTNICLLYTSPSPRDRQKSRMPSSA